MLEPIKTDEYTIKDSLIYAAELQRFDSKLVMGSFDEESLFTNIPLQEAIDLCVENLLKDKTHIDNFWKTLSMSCLLRPCLNHWSY